MKLFCVTHRDYPDLPHTDQVDTILVGMNEANIDLKTRDFYPEISKLNIIYNEVEAEKYIREHVNDDIKGLFQYSCRPDMSLEEINGVLKNKKAICHLDNVGNMYQQYCACHCQEPMNVMLDVLKEKNFPITDTLRGPVLLSRHILITTNDIFNRYFDFAWPVYEEVRKRLNLNSIEAAEEIVKQKYGSAYQNIQYQTRILGFLGERLWSLWFFNNYSLNDLYIPKFITYEKMPLG